ncbi:hypothetical protein LMH49_11135, partial [Neisseria gonorrhoeae]|uniref:hypothetical protein n=1 Tax=Neisseria gonorrhoeae TaxID=485 RepID=UPI001E56C843
RIHYRYCKYRDGIFIRVCHAEQTATAGEQEQVDQAQAALTDTSREGRTWQRTPKKHRTTKYGTQQLGMEWVT